MNNKKKFPNLEGDEEDVFVHADGVIRNYQFTHEERVPKAIKMNSENAEVLRRALRKLTQTPDKKPIAKMRGSEILVDDQLDLNEIIPIEQTRQQPRRL